MAVLAALVEQGEQDLFTGDGAPFAASTIRVLAAETVLGQFDGYRRGRNFRVFHQDATDRWHLIPWGMDMSMFVAIDPFPGQGILYRRCVQSPACLTACA